MQNGRIYTKALFNEGNPQERLPRSARNDEYHQSPRRVQAPLVLARNVSDTAISPSPRPCEERQRHSNSYGLFVIARSVATWQSYPPPVLARNVSDTAISPAPRPCEERQRHGNLTLKKKDCFTLSGFAMTAAFKKAEISTDRTGIHILFWILLNL